MTDEAETNPAEAMTFEVLRSALIDGSAARLGRLALAGRKTIDTPNFFALTSRGVVPHITPDNVDKHLDTGGVYMALEDFIERPQQHQKRQPPIYDTPTTKRHPRPLHSFTATPPSVMTILGARRIPAVASPMGNTNTSVSVFTSQGFQVLTTKEYHQAVATLQPDIAIPLADLSHHGPVTPTSKRALRMAERTDEWLGSYLADLPSLSKTATYAPIPPVPFPIQWEYLSRLSEDLLPLKKIAGLALYDPDILPDLLTAHQNLTPLPRLSLSAPPTPHHILRHIALGTDIFTLPFLNTVSDSGLALTFSLTPPPPTSPSSSQILPLATDLSTPQNATSLTPLSKNCTCYACTAHHAAYIHHLLSAREMLAWTLLQMHNHAVLSQFFADIRASLLSNTFTEKAALFARSYEPEFPAGMGERPRARGYQYKSAGGDGKRNRPAWEKFEGDGDKKEVGVEPGTRSEGLETPLVPDEVDGTAAALDHMGFAEIEHGAEQK
ncbi:tRNA-guanine(15) transglycosylase-like protein [Echria macrotheca]|uniref:Queuine tRNA-ribosyltransferase accessory subunit 2 n=1 Tax=Echria macrotheca TaxID=438768 RepID=A0AAJ0BP85_9PEZI|nr:tRNA-guanine(15) transglycosylase-like protein [Echria macrotheca]